MKRYSRNMITLSPDENQRLQTFKVCVIGCGGLGGYVVEMLGRLGIGTITAVDGDVFDESNLNRQILSNMNSLGESKALQAKERMALVNPLITVNAIPERFTEENGKTILEYNDVVVDALDSISSRILLERMAGELGIPLVHGAIAGWYGQVSTIFPGDNTFSKIYPDPTVNGMEKELGNPSFTPALVASIQVSEVLKILIGRGEILRRKLLYLNLLDHEYEIIELY